MHIIREKTDCNQKMKCGYLVPPKVWRTFFFYCSPRLIPIRESMSNGSIRKNWSWTLPVGSCEKVIHKKSVGRAENSNFLNFPPSSLIFNVYLLARSYGERPRPRLCYSLILAFVWPGFSLKNLATIKLSKYSPLRFS